MFNINIILYLKHDKLVSDREGWKERMRVADLTGMG